MKCEHCGYDAPERAVICPECGEILPRPKKAEEEETEKAAVQKKTAPDADSFSMPFLSAPADLEKADGIAAAKAGKDHPSDTPHRGGSRGSGGGPGGGAVLRLFRRL